jgi:hypothetical protein
VANAEEQTDWRMVQNGSARDGWAPPRGRGDDAPASDPEPIIGLPEGVQPGTSNC